VTLRKRLLEKIGKKEQEIVEHESRIREAKAYIQALQDSLKMIPRSDDDAEMSSPSLREGSTIAKAYELLKEHGQSMAVAEILKGIGKEVNKPNRQSITGSISAYVRMGRIFTRPFPGKFGLKEFDGEQTTNEPPDNFGVTQELEDNI
jgi:hypothetical protein